MFKRLTCCIKGHKPFPNRPPEPIDPSVVPLNSGTIGVSLTAPTMVSAGSYLGVGTGGQMTWLDADKTLSITRGPYQGIFAICARCAHVYWTVEPHGPTITSVANLPELKRYHEWRIADDYETKQRAKNPLADKLYRQYQVAMKLVGDSNES